MIETTYRGKPLSEHTKEELMAIIEAMVKNDFLARERRQKEFDILTGSR